MKEKIQQLVSHFEKKSEEVQKLIEKGESMDADDIARAKALNEEMSTMRKQITDLKGVESDQLNHKSFLNQPSAEVNYLGMKSAGQTHVNGEGMMSEEGEGLLNQKTLQAIGSPEYKSAFRTYLRKGEWGLSTGEVKALQIGVDSEGGFLVPLDMMNKIVEKTSTPTRVYQHVTHLNTSRDTLIIPKVDYGADDIYSNGMRVTWTGETVADDRAHEVTQPSFGQISIPVHTAMMSLRISNDMLEDSLFPIQSWCADKFREAAEMLTDNMILNGSGVGQPSGILRNPGGAGQPMQIPLWTGQGLDANKITQMGFSVPEQYVSRAQWIMNLTHTANGLASLKDTSNRPLWGAGLHDAGLENGYLGRRLCGFPIIFSGLMPNNTADQKSFIFGDLSGYYLVKRAGFSIQVLREVEALRNRLVMVGRLRIGGAVAEPWKIKVGVSSE